MPTNGLINSGVCVYLYMYVYIYLYLHKSFRVPSAFTKQTHHFGPVPYRGLTHFLAVTCQLCPCFSRTWGQGINSMTLSTLKATWPRGHRNRPCMHMHALGRSARKGNLPAPGGGVPEVFRAPEETCRRRAGEHPPPPPPLLPPGCCPSQLVSRPNAFQSCAQDTLLQAVLETRARSGRGREGARGRR